MQGVVYPLVAGGNDQGAPVRQHVRPLPEWWLALLLRCRSLGCRG